MITDYIGTGSLITANQTPPTLLQPNSYIFW